MPVLTEFLARHPTLAVFLVVLAEQSGIPIPATPALLAVGAAKASAPSQFASTLFVAVVAAVAGDLLWYWLGRRYGRPILGAICRVAMAPASCAKRATDAFGRRGPRLLLVAKFIPGVSTTAPPLAALFGVPLSTFLIWDAAGSALWAATFMVVGALFSEQISDVLVLVQHLGTAGVVVLLAALAGYVLLKAHHRRRFMRRLRVNRVAPAELATLIAAGAPIVVADLRHELDVEAAGTTIPGAIRVTPEDLARQAHVLPADRDVVVYCSCPDEATSAMVALRLRAQGIDRIRPLAGGFDGWLAAGLPVVPVEDPASLAASARGFPA